MAARVSDERLRYARRRLPGAFVRSPRERLLRAASWSAFLAFTAFCLWWIDADPMRIWDGLGKLGWMFTFMFPPSDGGRLADLLYAMLETLSMAFLGTLIAFLFAIPLGFLGAKNVIPGWVFHIGLRRLFDGLRGIDALIWALVFVNAVGLGPFAGILAIAVSDTGTLSKLFAEAIENVDPRPIEGTRSAGAGRVQAMRFAVLPQVFPVMISQALYFFESNTRSATILGVVGAGGIGLELSDRIRVMNWDEVCFIILLILVTVAAIDVVSREIRMRVIDRRNERS